MLGALLEVEMSKKRKTHHARTFLEVVMPKKYEKVHAAVVRSTCPSQNVQNTPCSEHFLEVEMSKKCTPLWRAAHFQIKMLKAPYYMFGPLLDV